MGGAARSFALTLPILLCGGIAACSGGAPTESSPTDALAAIAASVAAHGPPVDFARDVKPVLDNRCVVCHACYDAPCQLVLSRLRGRRARREPGAGLRLEPPGGEAADAPLRRRAATRRSGARRASSPCSSRPSAVARCSRMLALGHAHPFAEGQRLPDERPARHRPPAQCPNAPSEFDDYAHEHPQGGMPYGMAPLAPEELRVLAAFASQARRGARGPRRCRPRAQAQVARWETFLNGDVAEGAHHRPLPLRALVPRAPRTSRTSRAGPSSAWCARARRPASPIDEIATRAPLRRPRRAARSCTGSSRSRRRSCTRRTSSTRSATRKLRRLRAALPRERTGSRRSSPATSTKQASNPFVTFDEMPAAQPLPASCSTTRSTS